MTRTRLLVIVAAAGFAFVLSGCGSGSSGSVESASNQPPSSAATSSAGQGSSTARSKSAPDAVLKIDVDSNDQNVQALQQEIGTRYSGLFVSMNPATGSVYVFASRPDDVSRLESLKAELQGRKGITSVELDTSGRIPR